jgi:hypothetical protein
MDFSLGPVAARLRVEEPMRLFDLSELRRRPKALVPGIRVE